MRFGWKTCATNWNDDAVWVNASESYAGNWNELVPGFMVIGVLVLAGAILIPFFRQAVGMSAYEYFGQRFYGTIRRMLPPSKELPPPTHSVP